MDDQDKQDFFVLNILSIHVQLLAALSFRGGIHSLLSQQRLAMGSGACLDCLVVRAIPINRQANLKTVRYQDLAAQPFSASCLPWSRVGP